MRMPDGGRAGLRKTMTVATALGLCLALTGCKDDDPSASPEDTTGGAVANDLPDPCGLLTVEQIEAASGGIFKEGEFDTTLSNDFQSICNWYSASGFTPFVQVLITGRGDAINSQRASAEEVFTVSDATVAGGSDAYIIGDGTILGMVVGTYFVQVSYVPDGPDDVHAITIPLAEDVAAAL